MVFALSGNGNSEAVVLFDGVCNLCNTSVNFIIDNDRKGYFKFASLQSHEALRYLRACSADVVQSTEDLGDEYLSTVVLYENGCCYKESTAVLRIARKLKGGWPLLYAFIVVPRPIRDVLYRWVARNRYRWFGKQDACRLPTPELRTRFVENLVP